MKKPQLTADMKNLNGLTPDTKSLLHDLAGFDFFDELVFVGGSAIQEDNILHLKPIYPLDINSIRIHFEREIKQWISSEK